MQLFLIFLSLYFYFTFSPDGVAQYQIEFIEEFDMPVFTKEEDTLWIGGKGKLVKYEINTGKKTDYAADLIDTVISEIVLGNGGVKYILLKSSRLLTFNGNGFRTINTSDSSGYRIDDVAVDPNGYLWFANTEKVIKYQDGKYILFNLPEVSNSLNGAAKNLTIAKDGTVWVTIEIPPLIVMRDLPTFGEVYNFVKTKNSAGFVQSEQLSAAVLFSQNGEVFTADYLNNIYKYQNGRWYPSNNPLITGYYREGKKVYQETPLSEQEPQGWFSPKLVGELQIYGNEGWFSLRKGFICRLRNKPEYIQLNPLAYGKMEFFLNRKREVVGKLGNDYYGIKAGELRKLAANENDTGSVVEKENPFSEARLPFWLEDRDLWVYDFNPKTDSVLLKKLKSKNSKYLKFHGSKSVELILPEGIKDTYPSSFTFDNEGVLWGLGGLSVLRLKNDKWEKFAVEIVNKTPVNNTETTGEDAPEVSGYLARIVVDNNNQKYLCAIEGFFRLNDSMKLEMLQPHFGLYSDKHFRFTGDLIFETENYLSGQEPQNYFYFKNEFIDNFSGNYCLDEERNLWTVSKYPSEITVYYADSAYKGKEKFNISGIPDLSLVKKIMADKYSNIWVVHSSGVNVYNREGVRFQ